MADTIIAGTIVILGVLVVGYITYLRSVIELKMDDKPVSIQNMLFRRRLLFFHHKLNLHKNYPRQDIYKLSKQYDRMVACYYGLFVFIAVVVITMVFAGN